MIDLPYDAETEMKLLGIMLHDKNVAYDICANCPITIFYVHSHQKLFEVFREVIDRKESIDLHWIIQSLKQKNLLKEAGGEHYIIKIFTCFGVSCDWQSYKEELQKLATLRSISLMAQNIPSECNKKGVDSKAILESMQDQLLKFQGLKEAHAKSFDEIIESGLECANFDEEVDRMVQDALVGYRPNKGVSTGYPILDDIFGNLQNGAIYYVGARTSMGKTTFILNLINNMLDFHVKVGMFSMEMKQNQIAEKLLCMRAGIKYKVYQKRQMNSFEGDKVKQARRAIRGIPFFIDDQGG